ncbi:MAG: thioredoxin 1 [Candidatus Levybacteria bacterium]|nr:thioredoxin 1 [Candidatus Levybacteria bacterium]
MADLIITDQSFKQEVLESSQPVMVDFWAPWCGPCRITGPIIDELAQEFAGKVKIGKVNVDENSQTAGQYGVMSIPSIVFFKNGQPVKTMVGAQSKENYKQEIEQLLGS